MPLLATVVGRAGAPVTELVERRWTMNYAASVGDENPVYYDTLASEPVPAHPAYVSHLEWAAITELHARLPELTDAERLRGVHSFNDTTLHRPIRADDRLSCGATVVSAQSRRSGAKLTIRTETSDVDGRPVATSYTSMIYRGVDMSGADAVAAEPPGAAEPEPVSTHTEQVPVSAVAAHVFSECARDYNPIHTDGAIAAEAGLPGLILHGTATIAMALSSLVRTEAAGNPLAVRRFRARLQAMVRCPSIVTVYAHRSTDSAGPVGFEVLGDDGSPAISDGLIHVG